ncbi:NHL repeat-containing protein [Granulicella paludicola]|uniref:hypothetical protein n=1 Tax=Granulicella paludicola TaxID=474951 RepID=UPI0021E088E6|nr:hypothetical protein [Granulicella paludicola]
MGVSLIRNFRRNAAAFGLFSSLSIVLTGCTGAFANFPESTTSQIVTTPIGTLQGSTYGGQQPVWNSHVYLMKASTNGYKTTSTSILQAGSNTAADSSGNYYVTTNGYGNFTITGDYTCTYNASTPSQSDQLYLVSLGGNANYSTPATPTGGYNNAYIGLMAVLGACPSTGTFAGQISYIYMNEVSTVAAAYALAGFAGSSTTVGSTSGGRIGLANAFANANQLYDIQGLASPLTHEARLTTPASTAALTGTVPNTTLNTLGNILASCINQAQTTTAPPTGGNCQTLYNLTSQSPDTASAAIYIAQHPAANVATLYALQSQYVQFPTKLASQPNDFSIGIKYAGTTTANPVDVAIDANGYPWYTTSTTLAKLTPLGVQVAGSPLNMPNANYLSVDPSGNVWVTANNLVYEVTNAGANVTGSPYSNAVLAAGLGTIATDAAGAYVANPNYGLNLLTLNTPGAVTRILPSGGSATYNSYYNGVTGLLGGAVLNNIPYVSQVASGNTGVNGHPTVLVSGDVGNCILSLFICEGVAIQQVDTTTGFPGGLLLSSPNWSTNQVGNPSPYGCVILVLCSAFQTPGFLAADNANVTWASVLATGTGGTDKLARITNAGAITLLTGGGLNSPQGVAVDGNGNVFVANKGGNSLLEYAGSAQTEVTTSNGYIGASSGSVLTTPTTLDIDPSGNVWVVNAAGSNGALTEFIGLGSPVVRPLSAAGAANKLGTTP